jgi:hypothetical protein
MNEARKPYYNRCNPDEPLKPKDERNVDIDGEDGEVRGLCWVDEMASEIEYADSPVCGFFTGLRGSGKSTELRRLCARLRRERGANLFPILIDAEEVLDLSNPIGVPDILLAVVYKADAAVLKKEGRDPADAAREGRAARFWRWLTETAVELKGVEASAGVKAGPPAVAELSAGAKVVLDMKTSKSLREKVRDRIASNMTTFIADVHTEIVAIDARARKLGYAGIAVVLDSLEKLRGVSTNWIAVLESAEGVFSGGAPYLELPVHTIYTLPPAIALRLNLTPLHFLPMIKLSDHDGKPWEPGYEAAWKLIRQRLPDEVLNDVFGAQDREDRVRRIIAWSGGYPREIVRLLQTFVKRADVPEALFKRILSITGDGYRRTVPEDAYAWLARVHVDKKLSFTSATRETVDLMLQNNVVLRYQNDAEWFDVHPAILDVPAIAAEVARLRSAAGGGG